MKYMKNSNYVRRATLQRLSFVPCIFLLILPMTGCDTQAPQSDDVKLIEKRTGKAARQAAVDMLEYTTNTPGVKATVNNGEVSPTVFLNALKENRLHQFAVSHDRGDAVKTMGSSLLDGFTTVGQTGGEDDPYSDTFTAFVSTDSDVPADLKQATNVRADGAPVLNFSASGKNTKHIQGAASFSARQPCDVSANSEHRATDKGVRTFSDDQAECGD